MLLLVQFSTNCRIGCCFNEKYLFQAQNNLPHSLLATAYAASSPFPCIEISLHFCTALIQTCNLQLNGQSNKNKTVTTVFSTVFVCLILTLHIFIKQIQAVICWLLVMHTKHFHIALLHTFLIQLTLLCVINEKLQGLLVIYYWLYNSIYIARERPLPHCTPTSFLRVHALQIDCIPYRIIG